MSAKVQRVVFLALVLDLLAFTIPLPLFPRLIEWYTSRESSNSSGFLNQTLSAIGYFRGRFLAEVDEEVRRRWDVVLLGGCMGSLFSTLQFSISPFLGSLSDRYGRKRILLLTMIGNILSAIVWVQSTSFASFILARAIGGVSEGNVQLSIAILSDVSTPSTRGKTLSLVGIAFGICFCIGPPIGAYFASHPFAPSFSPWELNVYATPAALTVVFLLFETMFLAVFLPETKGKSKNINLDDESDIKTSTPDVPVAPEERLRVLGNLQRYHFFFLAIFSGVEFTLTFLSFDLFDWNNSQNGRLLGFIGVLSTLLQGGYVRRAMAKTGELAMARRGVSSCVVSFFCLAVLPFLARGANVLYGIRLMYLGAAFLAFTSATVVNSLTAMASLQCDEDTDASGTEKSETHPQLAKGRALGKFRSSGQLGRAIGPLLACASYWTFGPSLTYFVSASAMFILTRHMKRALDKKEGKTQSKSKLA